MPEVAAAAPMPSTKMATASSMSSRCERLDTSERRVNAGSSPTRPPHASAFARGDAPGYDPRRMRERALLALSSRQTQWVGLEAPAIVADLADVLRRELDLDAVTVSLALPDVVVARGSPE